jgi:hypothetical protein
MGSEQLLDADYIAIGNGEPMVIETAVFADDDVVVCSIYARNAQALRDANTATLTYGVSGDAVMSTTYLATLVYDVTLRHGYTLLGEKLSVG